MALHLKSTGIDFADFSDATESSELLDDYEEGSFTPTATTNVASGMNGHYSKTGDVCFIHAFLGYSNTSNNAGTQVMFGALPFTVSDGLTGTSVESYCGVGYWDSIDESTFNMWGYFAQSSTECHFYWNKVLATAADALSYGDVGNAFAHRASGHFITAG